MYGSVRRVALEDPQGRLHRISHLISELVLHPATLETYPSIFNGISRVPFDEYYDLAAQSFVAEGFNDGFSTMNTNISEIHYVLAALRLQVLICRLE